jgi:hypothetical protein
MIGRKKAAPEIKKEEEAKNAKAKAPRSFITP